MYQAETRQEAEEMLQKALPHLKEKEDFLDWWDALPEEQEFLLMNYSGCPLACYIKSKGYDIPVGTETLYFVYNVKYEGAPFVELPLWTQDYIYAVDWQKNLHPERKFMRKKELTFLAEMLRKGEDLREICEYPDEL